MRRIAVMLLAACVAGCGSATNLDTTALVTATGKQSAWTGDAVQTASGTDVEATGSIKAPDSDTRMASLPVFYHFLGLY